MTMVAFPGLKGNIYVYRRFEMSEMNSMAKEIMDPWNKHRAMCTTYYTAGQYVSTNRSRVKYNLMQTV